jgi:hypothetical protein
MGLFVQSGDRGQVAAPALVLPEGVYSIPPEEGA